MVTSARSASPLVHFKRLAVVALLAGAVVGTSSCNKRDANVEADYNSKKASAETLVTQITTSMPNMKKDHDNWVTTLDAASAKTGADTAKINTFKNDMQKHDADGQQIMALTDSVKMYMNATADNADAFKTANDRLGSNFDQLNDKWKSYQDEHARLTQNIQQFAVNTAGDAVTDSAKASADATKNGGTTAGSKTDAKTGAKSSTPTGSAHETAKHTTGGVPKSSGTTGGTSTNNNSAHETVKHTPGGVPKSSGH